MPYEIGEFSIADSLVNMLVNEGLQLGHRGSQVILFIRGRVSDRREEHQHEKVGDHLSH